MAKTKHEIQISLTTKEVGEILRKAFADKFSPNSAVEVSFDMAQEYDDFPGGSSIPRSSLRAIKLTGTTESEIKLS